ncbi:Hypothetical predicted protein [Mytilus galloprovincialis]|uniref:Uncharacterized protein n=1 Tax=Mytilus galloprovincialis TaxID=29158 RepID=A0A8B6CM69_MYTGA|nr:Hypothetical predicted protein [Mytilus galloprovincialis]
MLVSALCIEVSELIVTQLDVDRIECSFSPNLNDAVVMPYDTRKVQRINYNSLHNTGTTGDLNSSSEEDIHSSGLFSPLGSPGKMTSSRPISLLSSTFFPAEGDMDEVKKIVSSGLDSYDEKEDEKIEAELALVLKEKELIKKKMRSKNLKEQLKREKAELEELKKHDEAVGGMVKGKKGNKRRKKRGHRKRKSQVNLVVSVRETPIVKVLFYQKKRKTRSKKHKQKSKSSDIISESSLSDRKYSSSESDSYTRSIRKKYRKNKRKSGLVVSSRQKTKYPQDCLQSKLQLEYANKKIKFEDLKFHQFVAGEMEIIVSCKSDKEKNGRLTLLKKISYYYELYDWKALLQFYAA